MTGLHVAAVDTDMTAGWDSPKSEPADVARAGLDGIEAGRLEIAVDETSARIEAALSEDPRALHPGVVRV